MCDTFGYMFASGTLNTLLKKSDTMFSNISLRETYYSSNIFLRTTRDN
jgi:hypothetical protein